MKTIVAIEPSRENWRQFCEEPELTKEEWILWRELSALARANEDFFELCFATVPLPRRTQTTRDWSDVVQGADDWRRFMRAHFPIYERWLAGAPVQHMLFLPQDEDLWWIENHRKMRERR